MFYVEHKDGYEAERRAAEQFRPRKMSRRDWEQVQNKNYNLEKFIKEKKENENILHNIR